MYLVVGQGVAGISVAHALRLRGQQVHVIDQPDNFRASSTAAGIINPITGKRFVLSWRFLEFFPVAKAFYQSFEHLLDQQIWHDRTITRIIHQNEDLNSWISRSGFNEMSEIMSTQLDTDAWKNELNPFFVFGKLQPAAQVNLPLLCQRWRAQGIAEGWFTESEFDHTTLPQALEQYEGIVFATGHTASESGLFMHVPWKHAKGTAAHVYIPNAPHKGNQLLKDKIMLAPLPETEGLFWVGANYEWQQPDSWPTADGIDFITTELSGMLKSEYQIREVKSGIRPVAKDRRPVLGASTIQPKVFIFNGLGAKGAILAPYWAQHLVAHILDGLPLDSEVDVARFTKRE
jgi:glycine oxidase